MVKLQSLVEYLMAGIELSGDISINVVGGCKYYTNFANIMKETLGDKAIICNPTKEVDHSSHGCWKVVNDMMEGKVKIEGSDCVWGLEEVNEESKQQCKEDKKKMDKQGEGDGGCDGSEDVNEQRTSGSDSKSDREKDMTDEPSSTPEGTQATLAKPNNKKTILNASSGETGPISVRQYLGCTSTLSAQPPQPKTDTTKNNLAKAESLSHPVTIKVCEYQRLPIPHRLKSVDFTTSIRDFMKKMLIQEKEILKMNSISTLWNDISKRIFEKIDKLRDQDKADEMLLELHALDKKKYSVLMDSVNEMNKEWKELAGKLNVTIVNEMAKISVIQNEWNEEKAIIEKEVEKT